MPEFNYRAVNPRGELVTGVISSENLQTVQQRLQLEGLVPVEVKPKAKLLSSLTGPTFNFKSELSLAALGHFCRQLAVIMLSGVHILKGLEIMAQQTPDKRMQAEINRIYREVQTGRTISEAMADRESPIPKLLTNMVATGEASGTLDQVLRSMANFYDQEHRIRQKIKSASIYPAVMGLMAVALMAFFFNYLLPQLVGTIIDSGGQLPTLTKVVVGISQFTSNYWWGILVVALGLLFFSRTYLQTPPGRLAKDRLLLKIPLLGSTLRHVTTMRFARTAHILIKSGLPFLQGLEFVKQNVNNALAEQAVEYALAGMQRGESLAENLTKAQYFDPLAIQMIAIGEETGELEGILAEMAEFYDREAEAGFAKLLALVEPLMLLIIGGIVSIIIVSVMLPMMDMFTHIKR